MCIHVYICIHMYTYVYMCVHVYACVYICISVCMRIQMYQMYTYACLYACVCMRVTHVRETCKRNVAYCGGQQVIPAANFSRKSVENRARVTRPIVDASGCTVTETGAKFLALNPW